MYGHARDGSNSLKENIPEVHPHARHSIDGYQLRPVPDRRSVDGLRGVGNSFFCVRPGPAARQLAQRRFQIRLDSSSEGGFMRTRTKSDERQCRITLVLLLVLLLLVTL